jgi:hypothetical protein
VYKNGESRQHELRTLVLPKSRNGKMPGELGDE